MRRSGGRGAPFLLALAVGMVLADSSVVTLALPAILRELDTTVSAVAWVLIAFNLALAAAAVPGWRLARARPRVAFALGSVGFAAASLACAAAPSLGVLIAGRVAQGVFGAVVVAAALELLVRGGERRRAIGLWAAAGVLGGAVGPALGGFLTEAFSWEAMFALQAPVALLALLGARVAEPAPARAAEGEPPGAPRALSAGAGEPSARAAGAAGEPSARSAGAAAEEPPFAPGAAAAAPPALARGAAAGERLAFAPLAALALVSAALFAALFLLVVMLIEGWRLSPGAAAAVVTAMPLAALVAGRWARERHRLAPALPGAILLAGGLAALGLLPGTGALWTIAPQVAIGAGLGLALGALIGVTVDADGRGDVGRPASWTIAARHAGVVFGLLVLTPIFTADLNGARGPAELAGTAHLLDAPISLKPKIALARSLSDAVSNAPDQELPDLDAGFAAVDVPAKDRAATEALRADLDGEIDRAATAAFSRSFLAAALLALLAAAAAAAAILRWPAAPARAGAADELGRGGVAAEGLGRGGEAAEGFARGGAAAEGLARGGAAAEGFARGGAAAEGFARGGAAAEGVARTGAAAEDLPLAAAPATNGSVRVAAPSLNVALPAAIVIATALVAAYVALGGADYGPTPVANPCAARERPIDERTQRVALAVIDGGACELGRGREELLLALLDGDRPNGVTEDELTAALLKGVDRAEDEDALGGFAATGLRLAIRASGALGIVGLLLPR